MQKMKRRYPKSALYWKEELPAWPWKLFLAVEAVLYIWFMAADISRETWLVSSDAVKYVSMWVCFFMALYLYDKRRGNCFMLIAQAAILPADFILLFGERFAWLGIVFFLIVQVCYFLRMRRTLRDYLRPRGNRLETGFGIGIAAAWLLLLIGAAICRLPLSAEVVLAALYILSFLFNCILAVYEACRFQKESGILFAFGMILFFLCDIHVGLTFLRSAMPAGSAAAWYCGRIAPLAMWLFYLPGQVLLVSSSAERPDGWSVRRR